MNTTTIFPHGLTQQPLIVQPWLKCIVNDGGYSAGDRVLLPMLHNTTEGFGYGYAVWLDDNTNIKIHTGNRGPALYNRSTGAVFIITTLANWKMYVRAWG